ncbi:transposase [Nonomuraea aurantiaca]|uniref:transposase n=1 Tax=Nonomuraea aurantiaca TaxID=2878562 RepID=UPI001CD91AFC|nr:transposase [Nonomuraea aurantiaca]MCA2229612.1 transposase [Nonomuraea aurantiaca]
MSPDGHEVEPKILNARQVITVSRWYGKRLIWIADCRSVAEVRRHVALHTLTEVVRLPGKR